MLQRSCSYRNGAAFWGFQARFLGVLEVLDFEEGQKVSFLLLLQKPLSVQSLSFTLKVTVSMKSLLLTQISRRQLQFQQKIRWKLIYKFLATAK